MLTDNAVAIASLVILIIMSTAAALLYLVLVARRRYDSFTWAVLGLLAALAATNIPVVYALAGHPLPIWVGATLRAGAALAVFRLLYSLIIQAREASADWCESRKTARAAERAGASSGVDHGNREE